MNSSPHMRSYLITIPTFARPGVKSVVPSQEGKDSLEVVIPKGTTIQGKDISLYHLLLNKEDIDPFPPLSMTHCFFLKAEVLYPIFQIIYYKKEDGSTGQRRREERFQSSDLSEAIRKVCQIRKSRPLEKQPATAPRQTHDSLRSLEARAEAARLVSGG